MTQAERDKYHVNTLVEIEYLAQQAERRAEEQLNQARESVRRAHGQYFRHLRKWIKQGDQP